MSEWVESTTWRLYGTYGGEPVLMHRGNQLRIIVDDGAYRLQQQTARGWQSPNWALRAFSTLAAAMDAGEDGGPSF